MIVFEYQFEQHAPKIRVELSSESTISEVLEQFEGFLRASGYHFDGTIDIIEDNNASA